MTEVDFGKEEHDKLMNSVKEYSDSIEEKYDKKIENLTPDKEEEVDFTEMNTKFQDLKKEVSEARKNGKEVFVAHNLLLSYPSAERMAKATEDEEDIDKAQKILEEAEKELEDAKEFPDVDVRKEVEERFKKIMKDEPVEPSREGEPDKGVEPAKEIAKEEEKVEEAEGIDIDEVPAHPRLYFHLPDRDLRTIRELADYIPQMTEEEYLYYYYSRGINDYSEWIKGVFGHEELAEDIKKVKDPDEVVRLLKESEK